MVRFHLDQHVPAAVAQGLRRRGVDVTTTAEAGLQNATDAQHLEHTLREGRVIFTQDHDFLRLHQQKVQHAGIIYSKQGAHTIGEIVRYLHLMHDCMTQEEMRGQVEYF